MRKTIQQHRKCGHSKVNSEFLFPITQLIPLQFVFHEYQISEHKSTTNASIKCNRLGTRFLEVLVTLVGEVSEGGRESDPILI